MKLMQCKRCGGELNKEKDGYVCAYCHATYEDDTLERAYAELKNSLENLVGSQIEENAIRERERSLANLRRQLWDKTHEKYVNSKAIVKICREIKKIDSDDFAANFYETMNDESEDYAQVTDFLDEIDVETKADYVDDVVEFVVKSLKIEYLTSLNMLVERAYTSDKVKYGEMISKIEAEAEKVEEGIYSLERPRDVFVAYSSKDVKRVNELVRYLEGQGIECFVAMRNLQQGRKSVENYEKALETAMDNCKVFLFVSSKNSRALSCDAIKRELPYVKRRDLEGKPEYRNLGYDKMPEKYRKPRIQYRIDDEKTPATDRQIKEFFGTLQWRYDLESVAEQVGAYLTEDVYEEREETPAPTTDKQDLYEEFKKRMREEEARKAEELRQAEEKKQADERRQEELRKAEEQRKAEEARRAEELRKAKESASSDFEIENGVLKKYTGKEKDVIIPDGVTVVGEFAFNGAKMTSLKIPESVTIIKNNAFYYCNELSNIEFSFGIMEIGELSFAGCSKLAKIAIPSSVTRIGRCAFASCANLSTVEIPSSVKTMGDLVFSQCNKVAVYVEVKEKPSGWHEGWSNYGIPVVWDYKNKQAKAKQINATASSDFEIENGVLKKYKGTGGDVIIPDGVTEIGEKAFYFARITSVTIPDSVTVIGKESFSYADITSVNIPESVTEIGKEAFYHCENLISVEIPKSVMKIGWGAFNGCKNLVEVTIPGVIELGKFAFADCSSLTNVTISEGVILIEDSAFLRCRSLTNVTIPEGVTSIGDSAFCACGSLPSITMPNSLRSIHRYAFNSCSSLTNVTIPEGVTTVGGSAFSLCYNLESVTIPNSVTTIGEGAFYMCRGLKSVTIPSSVTTIEERAFYISGGTYDSGSLKKIYAEASSKPSGWHENWNPDKKTVVWGHKNKQETTTVKQSNPADYDIKNGVLKYYNGKDENIVIPDGVTTIGKYALTNAKTIKTVIIPDSVETIEANAFFGHKNLTSVKLGKGVKKIGNGAFMNCKALESVEMENGSLEMIDKDAFSGCVNLKEIKFPQSLKHICVRAFYGCKGVTENIFIPKSVEIIEDSAFLGCTGAIYAEAMDKPVGWVSGVFKNWLGTSRPVKWGAVKTSSGMYHRKLQ